MKEPKYLAMRHKTVRKANDIIQQSRFSFSTQQQKILLYLIAQINPRDEEFKPFRFSIADFCRTCGIYVESGKNYQDLKDAILGIRNAGFWITKPDGKMRTVAWIRDAEIDPGNGTVTVILHDDMRPYLLQLKKNYTTYELVYTLHFKSKYTIRLYELIKSIHYHEMEQYKREYTVDDLRQLLDAETYPAYRNLKQRVLTPSIKEINEYSDKIVEMEEVRKGRKVLSVVFTIQTKPTLEVIRIKSDIDKEMGIDPDQLTLWDELQDAGYV